MQTQVNKLRDQLEDLVATWRTNFRPATETAAKSVSTPAASKSVVSKPAAKKATAAKKPAAKKATSAKKPAAKKTVTAKAS
jgi:hypothetical protein